MRKTAWTRLHNALDASHDLAARRGFELVRGTPLRTLAIQAETLHIALRRELRSARRQHLDALLRRTRRLRRRTETLARRRRTGR